MSVKVIPIDFFPPNGALIQPKDQLLHDKAVVFCRNEVNGDVDFSKLAKVWVAVDGDEVIGIAGYVMKVDIPLFRATNAAGTAKLHQRLHTFFADNGLLGHEVFIHLSSKETPEQRCANWSGELEAANAVPADRYAVTVSPK